MSATIASLNSTNVRNYARLAWERVNLAVSGVLAPERAVDRAARLFTTPPRFAHTLAERELLATGRGFVVASPEGRIAAWRFGEEDRPVVVLAHGWGGRGAQLRPLVPKLLPGGHPVVLFDPVGPRHNQGPEARPLHFLQSLDALV